MGCLRTFVGLPESVPLVEMTRDCIGMQMNCWTSPTVTGRYLASIIHLPDGPRSRPLPTQHRCDCGIAIV